MIDTELIQIIIQGGAVGLMASLFFFLYKLGVKAMTLAESLIGNHLTHLTESVEDMSNNMVRLMDRIDVYLFAYQPRRPTSSSDEPSSSSSDEADSSSE